MDWKSALIGIVIFFIIVFVAGIYLTDTTGPNSDDGLSPDEPAIEEMFYEKFEEDFPGDNWTITAEPYILELDGDPVLNCSDCDMTTQYAYSSSNGIGVSFDLFLPSNWNGFYVFIRDKDLPAINYAELDIKPYYGTISYWIRGHCVPTPQVVTLEAPFDDQWHNFIFVANTNGNAGWSIDGDVVMERSNFLPGYYNVRILGGGCVHVGLGLNCSEVLADNVVVASLGEVAQDISCEAGGGGTVFKNPCGAGYCWSNGVCCPSSAQYYCSRTDRCYVSQNAAIKASNGACTSFRVVC
jgi:hypothetical protein